MSDRQDFIIGYALFLIYPQGVEGAIMLEILSLFEMFFLLATPSNIFHNGDGGTSAEG